MSANWFIVIIVALLSLLLGFFSYAPSDGGAPGTPVAPAAPMAPAAPGTPDQPGTAVAANVLEQYGRWLEIDPYEGYEPNVLEFADGSVTLTEMYLESSATIGPLTYHLEKDGTIEVDQSIDAFFCEFLELQEVEVAGQTVPIVSLYMFEYDGRGAIITSEFAPEGLNDLFPDGYLSDRAQETLDRDGTSMMALGGPEDAA